MGEATRKILKISRWQLFDRVRSWNRRSDHSLRPPRRASTSVGRRGIERTRRSPRFPDGLAGHRLAGVASDRNAVRRMLTDQGANPLIVDAFRERRGDRASAA
jgi:hypothetical protein